MKTIKEKALILRTCAADMRGYNDETKQAEDVLATAVHPSPAGNAEALRRVMARNPASTNLYGNNVLMIDSGTFWRCRHGYTHFGNPCWRCGLRHPIRFLKHVIAKVSHDR